MTMVDLSALGSALASLQAAKDIALAMIGLRDTAAFQSKMVEFQSRILDAQNSAFLANDERSALIERVRELEAKMAKLEGWEAEKQRYKLEQLPPGVFVYTLKPDMAAGEPQHQICQTCYQRGKKSILHSSERASGLHNLECHECGTRLAVGSYRHTPGRHSDSGPNDWMAY